jgi:hypothetical protein
MAQRLWHRRYEVFPEGNLIKNEVQQPAAIALEWIRRGARLGGWCPRGVALKNIPIVQAYPTVTLYLRIRSRR